MSSRDTFPTPSSSPEDILTPTGEQGSTNEADRYEGNPNEPVTWNSSEYLDGVTEEAEQEASSMADKAPDLAQTAKEKAGEAGQAVQDKADAGMDAAASGLGQAASKLREQGQQHESTVGMAAGRAADTLESASAYLRDKDTNQLLDDVEAFVRQRPVESVLIAAGIGYLLSKIVK